MKNYLKKHKSSLIFAFLTLAIMVLIFCFSHQAGDDSSITSSGISLFLAKLFNKSFEELSDSVQLEILSKYSFFVRKAAHFSIFAALGFFSNLALRRFFVEENVPLPRFSLVFNALFCFVYACSDEFHQLFIAGRVGSFTDVLIDFSGSVTALLLIAIFLGLFRKNKGKKDNLKS